MSTAADRTIASPRFYLTEVGSSFLIQDTQHHYLFIKIEQWEIRPATQSFRDYAERILTVLNAMTSVQGSAM